jgi:tripartite-type tricarboxylate transporter receptor subunit TctC
VRILAVTSQKRNNSLPDIPTLIELGLGKSGITPWWGVLVPAGTPSDVIERLATALLAIAQRPDIRDKLRNAGFAATGRGPQAFAERIAEDVPKWREVIEQARIGAK